MPDRYQVRLEALRLIGRLNRIVPPAPSPHPRILVLRPDHLGDLLFLFPALDELRLALPEARLTLAVGPWAEALARMWPLADACETVPFPGFERGPKPALPKPYVQAWRLARSWQGRFDAALIARDDHWWGAMVAALAGIPLRLGWPTAETEPFLTDATETAPMHAVAANLRLVRSAVARLGGTPSATPISPEANPLRLDISPEAADAVDRWIERHLGPGTAFFCLHPGAGGPTKVWPLSRYQTLLRRLREQVDLPVVVTGSLPEADLVEAVASAHPDAFPAAGEFSVPQLAALVSHARLVLGSDSGPLHLAVAAGTPTLHIFGPADEARFGPWGPSEQHRVLTAPVPCRPCGDLQVCRAADELACMRGVTVDEVAVAVSTLLDRGS